MVSLPNATKIMLIRHAEKPVGDEPPYGALAGVEFNGTQSTHALIVRGWQRAGALTCLFAPTPGRLQSARLARPQFLYAAIPGSDGDSERPYQTIVPLSQKLQLAINIDYAKGQIEPLVDAVRQCAGVVLIAWEHGEIPKVANTILGDKTTAPQKWPADRFDMVWVFDWHAKSGKYRFSQVPQCLLAGDSPSKIH
jgi:hypothetical protein